MSLPPPGWSFEVLQASQSIESSDSGQPQEEPRQVSPKDEEYPEYPEHSVDASTSSGKDSEDELQRMVEAEGEEITEILTRFTRKLETVEANTVKMAEQGHDLRENFVKLARNSQRLHEQLAAVEASTTEIQTSMAALVERNRLHEIGTHNIRFNTQNIAKEAEKMGKEMDLNQIATFKQLSMIFKALRQINERLGHFQNGQPVDGGASSPGASEKYFGNLSLNTLSILTAFMLLLALAAFKYYEIIQGI